MIVDQTTKAHWLNLFDGMGRQVVSGQMLGLMQRAFRFCSNREVINVNPIESLRRSDVGLTPGASSGSFTSSHQPHVVGKNARASNRGRRQIAGNRSGEILVREITVDNFAGGGGASTGIELATGRSVRVMMLENVEEFRTLGPLLAAEMRPDPERAA